MSESISLPAYVDFTVWRGDTFRRVLTVTDDAEAAWDFSATIIKVYVRDTQAATPVYTLEEDQGITIDNNVVTIQLTDAQTNELKAKAYLYEIEYTSDTDDVRTWIAGKLIVKDRAE